MIDFQRKKNTSYSINQAFSQNQHDSVCTPMKSEDYSKKIYDHIQKTDNQIKSMEDEITMLKSQLFDLTQKINSPENFTNLNNSSLDILTIKNEIKLDLQNEIKQIVNYEINQKNNELNQKMDNFDIDFDRLIKSLKKQFMNTAETINQLDDNKLNITDYESQIDIINKNINDLKFKNDNKNIITLSNNGNENFDIKLQTEIDKLKKNIYDDYEKINLKILTELKNQADDIKVLYQGLHDIDTGKINIEKMPQINRLSNNTLSYIENEMSKKANLDQLNFALETQSKLNEAFSSASKISRFCWDSDGELTNDKYIQWSVQNINTALDVFKWENNSEFISILKNGVYKVVVGLISNNSKKNLGIVLNEDLNIITNNITTNYCNNEKGNIKAVEKYIACCENTKLRIIVMNNNDSNDNSEEAFLEISKII